MKKRTGMILLCCAAVVLVTAGLLVWRFVPRNRASVLSVDENTVSASFTVIETGTDNGETFTQSYTINSVKPGQAHYDAVMALLDDTKYYPSMWNLTPWRKMPVQSAISGELKMVICSFVWGKEGHSEVLIFRQTDDGVMLETRNEVHYLSNAEIVGQLTAYIRANGTKAE